MIINPRNHPFPNLLYIEYFLDFLLFILINVQILPKWIFFNPIFFDSSLLVYKNIILIILTILFILIGFWLPLDKNFKCKILFTIFQFLMVFLILELGGGIGLIIPLIIFTLRSNALFTELYQFLSVLIASLILLIYSLARIFYHIKNVFIGQEILTSTFKLSLIFLFFIVFILVLILLIAFLIFLRNLINFQKDTVANCIIVLENLEYFVKKSLKPIIRNNIKGYSNINNLTKTQQQILLIFLEKSSNSENLISDKDIMKQLRQKYKKDLKLGTIRNAFIEIRKEFNAKDRKELYEKICEQKELLLNDSRKN